MGGYNQGLDGQEQRGGWGQTGKKQSGELESGIAVKVRQSMLDSSLKSRQLLQQQFIWMFM